MNRPSASSGYQKPIYPKVVPPKFSSWFDYATTTLSQVEWVGGPVTVSSGFPIEAFGNQKSVQQARSMGAFNTGSSSLNRQATLAGECV